MLRAHGPRWHRANECVERSRWRFHQEHPRGGIDHPRVRQPPDAPDVFGWRFPFSRESQDETIHARPYHISPWPSNVAGNPSDLAACNTALAIASDLAWSGFILRISGFVASNFAAAPATAGH